MALPTFNVLSLCTGIGGLDLGLKLAVPGARMVCHCEREAYCVEVLVKRIQEGILDDAPIWSDVAAFDGKPWSGKVDCVTGGYPCTPFSGIGKKLGLRDKRWLWPHIARIVGEVQPEWCFFENVSKHLREGFKRVHDDLRQMGYRVAAGVFTAEEVGASQVRPRLFILGHSPLAHSHGQGRRTAGVHSDVDGAVGQEKSEEPQKESPARTADDGRAVLEGFPKPHQAQQLELGFPPRPDYRGWKEIDERFQPVESGVLGVADGSAAKLDRLRCWGNSVVPLVAAYAFHLLAQALGER